MAIGSASYDRLRMRLNRDEGMSSLDQVVLDYGFVEGQPFTFKDHEYQVEIIKDTRQRIAVRKCSQVGLSELMVQKTLAMLVAMRHTRIIFTLPTKDFAVAFSKDRFDGAIANSDHYSDLVRAGDNSASQKKIGDSILYVGGTYGAKAAISIPAEVIISDEVDFSNPTVLGKLNSRIRHAKTVDERGNRGYRYRFSTPTVDGYGVDIDFQAGDQRYYLCKCEHCEHWVLPEYTKHFVIPGYDGEIINFRKEQLEDRRFDTEATWIRCDHCGKNLWGSLLNPARRQWVAKHDQVWDHSYQVSPWDVPVYNEPQAIIKQLADYPLFSDYFNFVIGLPFSDLENTFNTQRGHKDIHCTLENWVLGRIIESGLVVGGMDVGKTIHLCAQVRVGRAWHVIWMEKIKNTADNPAYQVILDRYDDLGLSKLCIDAGPDISLVNMLVVARDNIIAVEYVNNVAGILPYKVKDDGRYLSADRTKTLSLLLENHNYNRMFYPREDKQKEELYQHLSTTKKIADKNSDGTISHRFIKTDKNDHWVHSLNYANIAGMLCEDSYEESHAPVPVAVGKVVVGSKAQSVIEGKPREATLKGMFGVGVAKKPSGVRIKFPR